MLKQPSFTSHAQQQALLGCATNIDPDKHPRRFAAIQAKRKAQAKTEKMSLHEKQRLLRDQLAPKVKELAKTMCISEVARELGACRRMIARIGEEHFFDFAKKKPGPPKTLSDVAKAYLTEDSANGG